jgi:hypothetical protein
MYKQRQPAASLPSNKPVQARPPAVKSAPLPLDQSTLKQIAGGVSTNAPNGNW